MRTTSKLAAYLPHDLRPRIFFYLQNSKQFKIIANELSEFLQMQRAKKLQLMRSLMSSGMQNIVADKMQTKMLELQKCTKICDRDDWTDKCTGRAQPSLKSMRVYFMTV